MPASFLHIELTSQPLVINSALIPEIKTDKKQSQISMSDPSVNHAIMAPRHDTFDIIPEENEEVSDDDTDDSTDVLREIEHASVHLASRVEEVIDAMADDSRRASFQDMDKDSLAGDTDEDGAASYDVQGPAEDCLEEDAMSKMKVTKYISQLAATTKLKEMDELDSESDCNSSDSGLDTGKHLDHTMQDTEANDVTDLQEANHTSSDQLAPGTDSFDKFIPEDTSEGIYENTTPLADVYGSKPIHQYEFGKPSPSSLGSTASSSQEFQDLEELESPGSPKRVWGVRESGSPVSPSPRTNNPTEDMIAKEIKELKEREDELRRLREEAERDLAASPSQEDQQEHDNDMPEPTEAAITSSQPKPVKQSAAATSKPTLKHPASHSITQPPPDKLNDASTKFNPSNYRPVVVPPRSRIMQEFIINGGKVTAFTQPDNSVIQLRKPQVHKAQPKVSAPSGEPRHKTRTALDKIQEELLETQKREEELKNLRTNLARCKSEESILEGEGEDKAEDAPEEAQGPPSLLHTKGKSGLISVWEKRIQYEKAA